MIDALLAIASDPLGAMLTSVLIFSLGLYPVGLMLGAQCSPCCPPFQGCDQCEAGELPDTLTVTLSGFPNQARSDDLITATIISGCFGSGATLRVLEPGGDEAGAGGPISSIELTSGGSGYALRARVEPELAVSPAGNAEFDFQYLESVGGCGVPTWSVVSATATTPGSGYTYGSPISIVPQQGTTTVQAAIGTIVTRLETPVVSLSASGGIAAVLTPTWGQSFSSPEKYRLLSVTVEDGGSGYTNNQRVTITPQGGTVAEQAAFALIRTERLQPEGLTVSPGITSNAAGYTLTPQLTEQSTPWGGTFWSVSSVTIDSPGEGWVNGEAVAVPPGAFTAFQPFVGAALAANEQPELSVNVVAEQGSGGVVNATLSQTFLPNGDLAWTISAISVSQAGLGYAAGGTISVTMVAGSQIAPLNAEVIVNEAGEITSVNIIDGGRFARIGVLQQISIYDPGMYYTDTGVIASVEVQSGGIYYRETGEAISIRFLSGGQYYKEDPSGPAYVSNPTVFLSQRLPSGGSGATFDVTIDDNPQSPTFGQITGIAISSGGDGYLAWVWRNSRCCGDYYDGMSVVVRRLSGSCTYSHRMCGVGNRSLALGRVSVIYRGPSLPPQVVLASEESANRFLRSRVCDVTMTATSNVVDCSSWGGVVATGPAGETATISTGGTYDPAFRNPGGIDTPSSGSSCFICCKGETAIPLDVEFEVRADLPGVQPGIYVGRLFLPRGDQLLWQAGSPTQGGGGFLMSAYIFPCSGQAEFSFVPDSLCNADDCHKKCQVFVTFPYFGSAFRSAMCNCQETPTCAPYGTYAMTNDSRPDLSAFSVEVELRAPL